MDVKQYFKDYPGSKQCFQTADGLIFHQEGDANLHAKSLKDGEVKKFTSAKFQDAGPSPEDAADKAKKEAEKAAKDAAGKAKKEAAKA